MKSKLSRIIICLLFAQALFLGLAFAEVKEIIAEGTYNMGDAETPTVAEQRAVDNAKRAAVEQAGTYLESFSEVQNLRLTKDELRVFASGIVETTVLDKKRTVMDNGSLQFWVKVKCVVNTDNIQAMKDKMSDESAKKDLDKAQADNEKYQREIEDLKKQLQDAKDAQSQQDITNKIARNENAFSAAQWYERGSGALMRKDYASAVKAYSATIQLDPQYANAYYERAIAYYSTQQYELALADIRKATSLKPMSPFYFLQLRGMLLGSGLGAAIPWK